MVMFFGYIVFLERVHWSAPESELAFAVGQWSAAVQIGLLLLGTLFARVVEPPQKKDGEDLAEIGLMQAVAVQTERRHVL
jgi:hypothetical protein